MKAVTAAVISTALGAVLSTVLGAAAPVRADEPKLLGSYAEWSAFTYEEKAGKVCYMAAKPQKEEGKYKRRGEVFFLVTHRPAEKSVGVVSVIAGYQYKQDSKVKATIGGRNFQLFTEGDKAWAYDDADDKALVVAMKRGLKMVIRGTSSRGTRTTDTYSLSGFSAAYNLINGACGVK